MRRGLHNQRGAALLMGAVFLILAMLVIGAAGLRMATTDVSDSSLQNDSIEALFLAESGLERAMQRLNAGTACAALAPDAAFNLGRGNFQIQSASVVGGLCRVRVLGRVLFGAVVSAQRMVEADIQQSGGSTWAVGAGGTILQWNGASWAASASGTGDTLNGVSCASGSSCWAVGTGGTVQHWDGTNWSSSNTGIPGNATLNSVACVPNSADDCIVVGYWTFIIWPVSIVYQYNAGTWTALETAWFTAGYNDAACTATECYAVGPGGRVGRRGGSWVVENSNTGQDLNGVDCFSAVDCWAVGPRLGSNFFYNRRNAAGWTPQPVFDNNDRRDLYDASCSANNDCWAVGARRSGNLYTLTHWNGVTWSFSPANINGADDLYDVDCGSSTDCWAVGASGDILRWNGSAWNLVASGTAQDLNSVYVPSGGGGALSIQRWREIIL